jgi:hypothetical protein
MMVKLAVRKVVELAMRCGDIDHRFVDVQIPCSSAQERTG